MTVTDLLVRMKAKFDVSALWNWRGGRATQPAFADQFRKLKSPTYLDLVDQYKGIAYACSNINARAVAANPFKLYAATQSAAAEIDFKHRGLDRRQIAWLKSHRYTRQKMATANDIVEITEHPILDLLDSVNEEMDGFVLTELTDLYQETCGTAYWYIPKDDDGVPDRIWLLPSYLVRPIYGATGLLYYEFSKDKSQIPVEDMLAFKFPNLRDPYGAGWSPLRACYEDVALTDKDTAWANTLMENQGRPDMIAKPKHSMTRDQARRLERSIQQKFSRGNAGKVVVMEQEMELEPLTFSSKELELLARRGVTKVQIANAFDVPLPLLEAKQINRATLEGALYQHAKMGVLPRLNRHFQRLNAKFCPLWDAKLFLWYENPVPDDLVSKAQVRKVELDSGLKTINDLRREDNEEDVAWGETPWLPATLVQVGADGSKPDPDADKPADAEGDASSQETADPAAEAAEQAAGHQEIQTAEANVLNGTQIAAATQIVTAVAAGELPRDAALGMLQVLFNLSSEQADLVLGSSGDGSATDPNHAKPDPNAPKIPPGMAPIAPGSPHPPGAGGGPPPPPKNPSTPPQNSGKPPPKDGGKAAAAVAGFFLGEKSRPEAIRDLQAAGVPYAKAWILTTKCCVAPGVATEKAKGPVPLNPHSKELAALMRTFFEKQRKQVLGSIKKTAAKAAWWDALDTDLSDWDEEMQKAATPFIEIAAKEGVRATEASLSQKLGSDLSFKVKPHEVQAAAQHASLRFCKKTNETTSRQLKDALQDLRDALTAGIEGDETNTGAELTRRVAEIFDQAEESRAERIALTESSRAVHTGQKLAAKASGVVAGFKWILSENACELCQSIAADNPDGIDIDGKFADVSDDPDYGDVETPPAHPYCQCTMEEILKDESDDNNEE